VAVIVGLHQVHVDRRAQVGEALVGVAATQDEPGLAVADVRQRPEPIHLQLEDAMVVIERFAKMNRF
jgi:hypothetical protein